MATVHNALQGAIDQMKAVKGIANPLAGFVNPLAGLGAELDPSLFERADSAKEFYRRLMKWIADFEASLDADYEVGVRLVSFGSTMQFNLTGLGYWNPSLIGFVGVTEQGEPVQLIQHVSQISVLLMKCPKLGATPRRVGFHAAESSDPAEDAPPQP